MSQWSNSREWKKKIEQHTIDSEKWELKKNLCWFVEILKLINTLSFIEWQNNKQKMLKQRSEIYICFGKIGVEWEKLEQNGTRVIRVQD